MFLILKKGKLREIVSKALQKAGNIRNLEIEIGIPRSSLSAYHMECRAVKQENLNKFISYLKIFINDKDILKRLPINWRQIKGGKRCVEEKKKNGTYEKQLIECQKKGLISFKSWHRTMKKENPKKYYLMQYEKFKKIGGYKFLTKNGEKVRNKLEKEVADLLKSLKINYKYEPLVKSGGRYFFPDFLINDKIILECTEWRGVDKAIKLNDKLKYLNQKYEVYVVIPKTLKRYYEILNHCLLLGIDDLKQFLQKSG